MWSKHFLAFGLNQSLLSLNSKLTIYWVSWWISKAQCGTILQLQTMVGARLFNNNYNILYVAVTQPYHYKSASQTANKLLQVFCFPTGPNVQWLHSSRCCAFFLRFPYPSSIVLFIHSFIHPGHFYSAPSSPLLLRGDPDYSTDTVSEFHAEVHRQLQVKDLPKVPTWQLERESNPRPSGWKSSSQPRRHHVPQAVHELLSRPSSSSLSPPSFPPLSPSVDNDNDLERLRRMISSLVFCGLSQRLPIEWCCPSHLVPLGGSQRPETSMCRRHIWVEC